MNKISRILATASVTALILAPSAFAQTKSSAPSLKIITPADGQTIYGDKVPILFAVDNFQVVDFQKYPSPLVGQGHIHVWLDDQNPTKESARKVTADTTTYSDVPYGEHTLKAELVANNHASFTPPIIQTVKFTSAPAATPSPAAASGFDKNTALVILVVVALVIVAAWWYTKEEDEMPAAKSTTRKTSKKKKTARKRRK